MYMLLEPFFIKMFHLSQGTVLDFWKNSKNKNKGQHSQNQEAHIKRIVHMSKLLTCNVQSMDKNNKLTI